MTSLKEIAIGGAVAAGLVFSIYKSYSSISGRLSAEAFARLEEQRRSNVASQLKERGSGCLLQKLHQLRQSLEGNLILPVDGNAEAYHGCRRRAFNQNQRGFPFAVARVASVKDVVTCLTFVQSLPQECLPLPLNVMCGGHSSKCMMDCAFVIDLILLKHVSLDKENMLVTVEGGAYLEEVDKALQPFNMAVPVGTYPQTGVGGLSLGGGYGWLSRKYGFTVDNFVEAEVVLLTGEVVTANASNHSDLFWGLRGGSGNFGIVTKFVFRVYQLPQHCLGGSVVNVTPTLASAVDVCMNFDKHYKSLSTSTAALLVFPAGAPVIPTMWAHFSDESDPRKVPDLVHATKLGGWFKVENSIKKISYHNELQRKTTKIILSGHIYHTLIQFGVHDQELPEAFFCQLLAFTRQSLPSSMKQSTLILFTMGGAMHDNDRDGQQTCMSAQIRNCRYFAIMEAYWKPECNEAGKQAARDWCQRVTSIIRPYSKEILRYAAGDDADPLYRDQAGFASAQMEKLSKLKQKYDPHNVLKHNMNIIPKTIN